MKLLGRQLYSELLKLFARKRTYMGFVAFLVIELLILLGLQTPGAHRLFTNSMSQHGLDFSHYFSGLTLAYVMITQTAFVLGSLYLALVCGDIVSKEVEDGTMRMVLSRPISRARILLLKYLTCIAYTLALTLFIVISSLLLGIAFRGLGGLIVVVPWEHLFGVYEAGPGLQRFALGTGLLAFFMFTIANLGFMFSCFNIKPASATIATLSLYLVDNIVRNVPYFVNFKFYFLSHHMSLWTQCFQPDIPWTRLIHSVLYLGTFDLLFLAIGAFYFARRDFKS
jgi:ABC-2 type transport system permease protein